MTRFVAGYLRFSALWLPRMLITLAGMAVVLPLAAAALARLFAHDENMPLVWLDTFTFWLYTPAYPVLAVALLFRVRILSAVSLAVVLAHLTFIAPDYLAGADEPPPEGSTLVRVYAANILVSNPDLDAMASAVIAADPDLLMIAEFSTAAGEALANAGVEERLPYQVTYPDGHVGIALYSRYPMTDAHIWDAGDGTPFTQARVEIGGREVTVIGVHTTAPISRGDKHEWDLQFEALLGVINSVKTPLIIGGDFNMTQHHKWYGSLEDAGLRNAHRACGRGNATTWPNGQSRLPSIRLDHVWMSDSFSCVDIREGAGLGSDHKPVIATIALPPLQGTATD
ncbi:hypothetical protein AYO38_08525 [bacterium SCGC AG-212-C10]|nr:hypothetical protein AYO38_08525 [bacterium SCGC AG-212-C10]